MFRLILHVTSAIYFQIVFLERYRTPNDKINFAAMPYDVAGNAGDYDRFGDDQPRSNNRDYNRDREYDGYYDDNRGSNGGGLCVCICLPFILAFVAIFFGVEDLVAAQTDTRGHKLQEWSDAMASWTSTGSQEFKSLGLKGFAANVTSGRVNLYPPPVGTAGSRASPQEGSTSTSLLKVIEI